MDMADMSGSSLSDKHCLVVDGRNGDAALYRPVATVLIGRAVWAPEGVSRGKRQPTSWGSPRSLMDVPVAHRKSPSCVWC